jgi:hypothetical protein
MPPASRSIAHVPHVAQRTTPTGNEVWKYRDAGAIGVAELITTTSAIFSMFKSEYRVSLSRLG